MGIDDLSLYAYQRVEAQADREARFELRWVSTLEMCAALAVTLNVSREDFIDMAKHTFRHAESDLARIKQATMRQMSAKTTTTKRRSP